MCANVCKHPTQKFFTEEIGLPVTLTPNYETFECQFSYGATPPDPADDVSRFRPRAFDSVPPARRSETNHAET